MEETWVLIKADRYEIYEPDFFDTYNEAHKEMKRQYEFHSKNCIGELNDDEAWCIDDGYMTNWKIFHVE